MAELLIHTNIMDLDEATAAQIASIKDHPALKGLIAIMPDCHFGAGCVIGFTGRFGKSVIPNLVGVDIGCGVSSHLIEGVDMDDLEFPNHMEALDRYIRKHVPLGFNSHKDFFHIDRFNYTMERKANASSIYSLCNHADEFLRDNKIKYRAHDPVYQLGTLGGGNHFIEINKTESGKLYLTVHTGSRNFGLKVANFYQAKAKKICHEMDIQVPTGQEYLPLSAGGSDYLHMLAVAQKYAEYNRMMILDAILTYWGLRYDESLVTESVHNYIDRDGIIRKGAIRAYQNEKVVIPLNMAKGIVFGVGKGNKNYNFSAPHGAGRVHGRKDMHRRLSSGEVTMDDYYDSMKDVFSTSVKKETIDESPFAYKKWEDIRESVEQTVSVHSMAKSVYNLKDDS